MKEEPQKTHKQDFIVTIKHNKSKEDHQTVSKE